MNIKEFEIYLKEGGKKHIIFDLDETLLTLLIDWNNWMKEMKEIFSQCNVELTSAKSSYATYPEAQNNCIKKFGSKLRNKIVEINYKNEKKYFSGYKLSPITPSLLDLAKKYAKLYIWTSNDERTVAPILDELNINELFEKIVYRNSVVYVKPDPEGFYLINGNGNSIADYLLIGDSDADKGAAIEAGIDFLNIREINL